MSIGLCKYLAEYYWKKTTNLTVPFLLISNANWHRNFCAWYVFEPTLIKTFDQHLITTTLDPDSSIDGKISGTKEVSTPIPIVKLSFPLPDMPLCSNPFCKWFWSGLWVPKHLLKGYLEHEGCHINIHIFKYFHFIASQSTTATKTHIWSHLFWHFFQNFQDHLPSKCLLIAAHQCSKAHHIRLHLRRGTGNSCPVWTPWRNPSESVSVRVSFILARRKCFMMELL